MELEKVIQILEKYQDWRRDKNVPPKTEMQSPTEIGAAIDYAISELKKLLLADVSNSLPLTKRNDYLMGWCDGVEYANNTKNNEG